MDDGLVHQLRGCGRGGHGNPCRPLQESLGDPSDLRRHGRGQHHGLPTYRQFGDDALDVGNEPHVEHPIRLVDHQNLHADQQQCATVEQVEQAARRGDHDVDRLRRPANLGADVDAADEELGRQIYMCGKQVHLFLNLECEFPDGFEN